MKRRQSELGYLLGFTGGGDHAHDLRRRQPSKVPFEIGRDNQKIASSLRSPMDYPDAFRRLVAQAGESSDELAESTVDWLLKLRLDVAAVQMQITLEFGRYDHDALSRQVQEIVESKLVGRFKYGLTVLPRMARAVCASPQELRACLSWEDDAPRPIKS